MPGRSEGALGCLPGVGEKFALFRRWRSTSSMEGNAQMKQCEVCSARVGELRRGRCWGCYLRWSEARPVGAGAACVLCNERRHDHLRITEILERSHPMCH